MNKSLSCPVRVDMLGKATQAEANSRRIGEQRAAAMALQLLEQQAQEENS